MPDRKASWGGAGRGQGRKPKADKMVSKTITLPREMVEQLQVLGEGKLSRGVRKLAEWYNAQALVEK